MRRGAAVLLFALAACSRPVASDAPPEVDTLVALEGDEPVVTIVRVEVDGHPAWMLLDSGAEMSVLDRRFADRCDLGSLWRATAGECDVPIGIVRGKRLEIGAVALAGPWFATLDLRATGLLDDLTIPPEVEIAGILGAPIFQHAVVGIEYGGGTDQVSVWPKGVTPDSRATWVPIEIRESRAFVEASVDRGGSARFLIDTGKSGSVTFFLGFVLDHAIAEGRELRPVPNRRLCGVTEELLTELDWLELGGFRFERPEAVLKPAGSPSDDPIAGEAGMLGRGVLGRFDVIFDYPRGRLGLIPRP